MSNQSQKADILLYMTNILIIKLEYESCLDPEKVKQQLYEALIITNVLIDFRWEKKMSQVQPTALNPSHEQYSLRCVDHEAC